MDVCHIAIKAMHLPAGLVARSIVELAKKSKRLQNFSDKIVRNYGTEIIGVGIPTLDTILEYVPIYKNTKDSFVQSITQSKIRPPDFLDQLNDFFWFEIGYFSPDLIKYGKNVIQNKIDDYYSKKS